MKMRERLRELVGHTVSVDIGSGTGSHQPIEGVLDEAGDDFIAVRVWDGGHGFPNRDEDMCYIPLKNVAAVIHPANCSWCHEQIHIKTAGRHPILSRLAGVIMRAKRNPRYL